MEMIQKEMATASFGSRNPCKFWVVVCVFVVGILARINLRAFLEPLLKNFQALEPK